MRSGAVMLNQEKGRRSQKFEDRLCETCDRGVEESVTHFLLDCPCKEYIEARQKFSEKLEGYCHTCDSMNVYNMWCGVNVDDRLRVVLGDCDVYVRGNPGEEKDAKTIASHIRKISNRFLIAIWDVRKHLLFPDLVLTSGAQLPRSGAAS